MTRASAALLLGLLLLPLALAQQPDVTQPPAAIPTQQTFDLGPLNITMWVMRDTRTISVAPTEPGTNPLGIIWNYNFTAGSLGIVYVRATSPAQDNHTYELGAQLRGPGDEVTIENSTVRKALKVLNGTFGQQGTADNAFQFDVGGAAPPGPLELDLDLQVLGNDTGTPQQLAARTVALPLTVVDPVPSFAVRKQLGDTLVFGWVSSSIALSHGGSGCLGGANAFHSDELAQGTIGIACFLALTHSKDKVQLNASLRPPGYLSTSSPPWNSQPFNATTGGLSAPVTSFPFSVAANATEGPGTLSVDFALRNASSGAELARDSLDLPFTVTHAAPIAPAHGPNWLLQAPLLVVGVAALGYLAQRQRRPRIQPRSQAMRELKSKRGGGAVAAEAPASAEEAQAAAEEQRQQVQEAAWDKKRKILEAKREDILKSIRLAEERKNRGEITEHVFNGIKERKERQLEQVEHEMEELR